MAVYKSKAVAFIAIMKCHFGTTYHRVSRLVVLPDYQGIGIGKQLLNFMAKYFALTTKLPFTIVTSNPQLVRGNLRDWKITRLGRTRKVDMQNLDHPYTGSSQKRLTVTIVYSPEGTRVRS